MGRRFKSPGEILACLVESLRPFCPGVKTMVILLLAMQSIAIALLINTTVALCVVIVLAAGVIKIYKVNTEPLFLLLLHTMISLSMLSDSTTTLAIIVAAIAVAVTIGDYELSAERVTVFLGSILASYIFNKPMAMVSGLALACVIAMVKLRPVRPATASLLALAIQAWAILTSSMAGSVVAVFYMTGVIGLFVLDKVADSGRFVTSSSSRALTHTHCNGSITTGTGTLTVSNNNNHQPVPNGYLQLSNPTESLDLHGHTVTGAMAVLHKFLRESEDVYRNNRAEHVRHVTVITGEGEHDDERSNGPLLKPTVLNFLKINKYKYEVSRETPGLIKVDLESHVF